LSRTKIFHQHYALVAEDVKRYGAARYILDVGTGPGWLLMALRQAIPNLALVGIDVSPSMVAQTSQNLKRESPPTGIDALVANAQFLPFSDQIFDRVISTGSLHHWKTPLAGLAEAHRVLREGGYALIYDLVRRMPKSQTTEIRNQFGTLRLAILCLHSFEEPFLDVDEMRALAERTEFELEETRFVGPLCCLVLRKAKAGT
jgi:ubiquinone/menaquinone biosynthesis C-methylase UbiE